MPKRPNFHYMSSAAGDNKGCQQPKDVAKGQVFSLTPKIN
jgi:hypothetical protein